MREIKFRAYCHGKIWQVSSINWLYFKTDLLLFDLEGYQLREWLKNVDLMQFTGLKDRNGAEIYEGDIIKHPSQQFLTNPPKIIRGIVEYKNNSFITNCIGWQTDFNKLEVIGNIYENPELLEGGE